MLAALAAPRGGAVSGLRRPGATDMASILITGGCGFLGATLAARARAAGHAVTSADVLDGADRRLDANDADAVAALVADLRPQAIVHLAAGLTDAG
jgi:dTDP-4-dehydrorhamnose reductase